MKKIIGVTLSLGLVLGIMASSYNSFSNKMSNAGFELSMLYSMSQALAEGSDGYFLIMCGDEEVTMEDGTKVTCHVVTCAGEGSYTCECHCS